MRDKYGLIVQKQHDGSLDGGDTINWTGHEVYLRRMETAPMSLFERGWGGYVRHFDQSLSNNGFAAYYNGPWDGVISRDQLTGIIAWLITARDYVSAITLLGHHACWGFLFAYNTRKNGADPKLVKWKIPDLTLFETWGCEVRLFGPWSWLLFPIALVCDFFLFLRTIWFNLNGSSDPISFSMRMFICREHVPTMFSVLAWSALDKTKLEDSLWKYWCGWRDNEIMYWLYMERIHMIEKMSLWAWAFWAMYMAGFYIVLNWWFGW